MLVQVASIGTTLAAALVVVQQVKVRRQRNSRLEMRRQKREEHDRLWNDAVAQQRAEDHTAD
ncbi:hypothetical protein LK533_03085 [Sphingomonas sp. PL-96]|uniref:hypothetical protein n=1 Tax=Sphingomonas sp. PL-96 TaxID=2887201 RepID=UPI001E36AD06|nr:hypothetical protein [Sphingomonas sp. PL-96]MCC2975659.1 hypothetical protein [Sphingomonas sp. PL-96]